MTETLNTQDVKEMLIYVADKMIENTQYLTEIDSRTGDGDHGITMAGGMKKVKEKLQKMELPSNVYAIFETAGKTMIMSMGGASGVIFGSLYQAGAKGMEPSTEVCPGELAAMFRKSLEAIKERGKASVGDKTMVDALEPAVCAMEENCEDGFCKMLEKAEAGARQGFESTREMIARFGRAKSLMERAVGYPDAGAASVWLIFRSMKEYLAENGSSVKER